MIKKNIPALTGYRAFAAYSVMFAHAADVAFSYSGALSPLRQYTVCMAYLGMTTFFVLSGFVITYNYFDLFSGNSWKYASIKFIIARFARLYPLYFVFLLSSIGFFGNFSFSDRPVELLSFLSLTQSWFNFQMIVFPPAWSISTEFFFYFVFMFIPFAKIKNIKKNGVVFAIILMLLMLFTLYCMWKNQSLITQFLDRIVAVPTSPNSWGWLTYFSPFIRVFEFIMGACAAWLFMNSSTSKESDSPPLVVLVVVYSSVVAIILLCYVQSSSYFNNTFLSFIAINFGFSPFLACIFYNTSKYNLALTRFFSLKPVLFCGEISYSVYIIQFQVFSLFPAYASPAFSTQAFIASSFRCVLFMFFTTVFAYGSYLMIEKPSRTMLRNSLTKFFISNGSTSKSSEWTLE